MVKLFCFSILQSRTYIATSISNFGADMAWVFTPLSYQSSQQYTATRRAVFSSMDIARVDVTLIVEYVKGVPLRHFSLFSPSIVSIGCFKFGSTFEAYLLHLAGGQLSSKFRDMPMIRDVVYLRDRSAIMPEIAILDDFAHVSGQRTKWSK